MASPIARAATTPANPGATAVPAAPFLLFHHRNGTDHRDSGRTLMATQATTTAAPVSTDGAAKITRSRLIELLNEDLAREYQAIIAYVVYSQVLKGAQYMSIAGELEKHAKQELEHALIIAKQIDYLGGTPEVIPKRVTLSERAEEMLRFALDNENET